MPANMQQLKGLLSPPENTKLFETTASTCWVDEHGIVCVIVKNVRRTIENHKEQIKLYDGIIKDGNKFCSLVDMTHSMPLRREVREYLASELQKYIKAQAIISAKPLDGTIATAFETINSAGYPMNQFTNEAEAKNWLKQFIYRPLKKTYQPLTIPDNTQLFITPIATYWVDEQGILCGISKKVERTIENYKKVTELFKELTLNGNKLCVLIDVTDSMSVSKEASNYIAEEMKKYVKAHAVISKNPLPGTIISNVFKLNLSTFPVMWFATEKESKDWLKSFL